MKFQKDMKKQKNHLSIPLTIKDIGYTTMPQMDRDIIMKSLSERGLKGCLAFDCFGAGQKVAQATYAGHDWRSVPESAKQMFEVFLIMQQLHELLWYLAEALTLLPARPIHGALNSMLEETERLTCLSPEALLGLDVAAIRADVNTQLLKTSELVRAETRHKATYII